MKKHISVVILTILIIMTITVNVYARSATYIHAYGYYSQHFDLDYSSFLDTSSNYWMGMNNSHYNWDHPYAMLGGSEVFLETSSANNVYTEYMYVDAYGKYTPITTNSNAYNKTTKFSIKYNTRVCNGKSSNFLTSVAGHEIGHGLGLADDNSISTKSLMYNYRNRETVTVPWYTDCYGVYDNWNR